MIGDDMISFTTVTFSIRLALHLPSQVIQTIPLWTYLLIIPYEALASPLPPGL